ncbi:MAG: Anaphase-promoting complex subunit 1 [Claussenomyces sp. TS43310]|nr:MAG: Anaphase-promoting complex subunit 1 [Claussenomyces sp. TS43310]
MATVLSLGVHQPTALPYLVQERLLKSEPSPDSYTWQIFTFDNNGGADDDELVCTRTCVVWSKGGVVRKSFRFEVENEPVTRALLTYFTAEQQTAVSSKQAVESPAADHAHHETTSSPRPKRVRKTTKALVVFLRTQAHVYFLSGTSHVIHLPFEVEHASAAPNGLILQRKLQERRRLPASLNFPRVPPNSFISSQPQPWSANSSVQSTFSTASLGSPKQLSLAPTAFLSDLWPAPSGKDDSKGPRLFSLTDPLSEMGLIVAKSKAGYQRRASLKTVCLDPTEELIHVSKSGDFSSIQSPNFEPLILAVTLNRDTSMYTVWRVAYVEQEEPMHYKVGSTTGAATRRRSSFAPGTGTGATTPVVGGQYALRDSFGVPGLGKSMNRPEDDLISEKLDFASSLDPDFEHSGLPRSKSRRVSSLLARADLSTSHERSAFSELAMNQSHHTKRRGESMGSQHNRNSLGQHQTVHNHANVHNSILGTSMNSVLEAPVDTLLEELKAGGDFEGFHNMGLDDDEFEGLRNEIVFSRIESVPMEQSNVRFSTQHKPAESQCKVFTLVAPPCASEDPRKSQIIMCILDSLEKKLLVLTLNTKKNNKISESRAGTRRKASAPKADVIAISWGEVMRAKGVLDACKLIDGDISRILILTESSDGQGELTLQAPWSFLMRIGLPTQLVMSNTRSVGHDATPQKKREGGFNRVLSQGPRALLQLRHPMPGGIVDVLDGEGHLHQIRIRMEPQDPTVRQAIDVCRSVLPGTRGGEAILVAWWTIRRWLEEQECEALDAEWSAFVVVLFAVVIGAQENGEESSNLAPKQRSRGFLRSSSGAQFNDTSWQAMLRYESRSGSQQPSWMMNPAWDWLSDDVTFQDRPSTRENNTSPRKPVSQDSDDSPNFIQRHIALAHSFINSAQGQAAIATSGYLPTAENRSFLTRQNAITDIVMGLHLLCEEDKLSVMSADKLSTGGASLIPILAQICRWVGWDKWVAVYDIVDASLDGIQFDSCKCTRPIGNRGTVPTDLVAKILNIPQPDNPPDVFAWIESCLTSRKLMPYIAIADITASRSMLGHQTTTHVDQWATLTPRTAVFTKFFALLHETSNATDVVEALYEAGANAYFLDTLPEAILIPLRESIISCQAQPSVSWGKELLSLVGREDVNMLFSSEEQRLSSYPSVLAPSHEASRDVRSICSSTTEPEAIGSFDGSAEVDRQSITRLIFKDDRRFNEAAKILNTSTPTVARCEPEPEWSESDLLEAQKEHVQMLATRTLAIPSGRGLLYFSARIPLLTEKFPIGGFNLHCVMRPTNNTVGVDKSAFTEEKVCWAFFHAGVGAGLSISRAARGIDTSWILYNKPQDLSNRHAGFLLALGLNGHLKSVAKWVAFKYLTPKHTMTSIGLLLGLAASYLGTMDSLITRLLSVHVTRMLPPGAAELNLSPLTQTSGIMGIGLLYCNTQHRRMSEIMVSEIEHIDAEGEDEPLRNEGYRLAAGFALGFINLGKGSDLKGLHDMKLTERLLRLAAGSKKVSLVHVLDKATAAATVAIALIFMKSENLALARKIDVPDSMLQYGYVRPDIFLLRTLARHLIMWKEIEALPAWIEKNLPVEYRSKGLLSNVYDLSSQDLPFYNIVTGLLFAIALRYTGSGSFEVRDLLLQQLDEMMRISKLPCPTYDNKLTRTTTRNCLDLLALCAATVMAGTGDLHVFRRLRALHGRDDADTPYGSHLSAHLAIGALFLGGGTYTFGTSNLAIAALIVAFYPLFPSSILDNRSHLQAFRHFWVLAAESRCLVARDLDTNRPVSIPLSITLRSGDQRTAHAPCLLPEFELIGSVKTTSREYWNISLDFENDSRMRQIFVKDQVIWIRRRQAHDASKAVFQSSLQALDSNDDSRSGRDPLRWLLELDAFRMLTRSERALVLGNEQGGLGSGLGTETSPVDVRLILEKATIDSGKRDRLQGLKLLFAWKEEVDRRGGELGWVRGSIIEGLKASVWLLGSQEQG